MFHHKLYYLIIPLKTISGHIKYTMRYHCHRGVGMSIEKIEKLDNKYLQNLESGPHMSLAE